MGDDELAGRMDGMGREIKGKRVKAVIGGEVGIDGPGRTGLVKRKKKVTKTKKNEIRCRIFVFVVFFAKMFSVGIDPGDFW